MPTSPPRERASRPSQHGHLVKSAGADEGAAVDVRTVGVSPTEGVAGPSARPTLDDFGGRSDALGCYGLQFLPSGRVRSSTATWDDEAGV
jgi:hypothetical protein